MAPVMFQRAGGVLGDAALEEKKEEKKFAEMTEFEKTRKRSELENNILKEKEGYKWWSDEFLEWFKENLTDKGYAKDKDPIEYLKSTGEDGLIQDAGMVVSSELFF